MVGRTTDVEEQGRDGCVAFDVDHAQDLGQLALPRPHEEQPEGVKPTTKVNPSAF